jgi:hypothetical protein
MAPSINNNPHQVCTLQVAELFKFKKNPISCLEINGTIICTAVSAIIYDWLTTGTATTLCVSVFAECCRWW